jgi:hypothetical protein
MFGRKIMRRTYGPVMENNIWRIRYNEDIGALLEKRRYSKIYQVRKIKMFGTCRKNAR